MHYRSRARKPVEPTGKNPTPYHGRRQLQRTYASANGMTRKGFLKKRKRENVAQLKNARLIHSQIENTAGGGL